MKPERKTPAATPAPSPAPEVKKDEQPARKKRAEELVSMTVTREFKLQHDDGDFTEYGVGIQDMPKSHAEHWYTKHHAEPNED